MDFLLMVVSIYDISHKSFHMVKFGRSFSDVPALHFLISITSDMVRLQKKVRRWSSR